MGSMARGRARKGFRHESGHTSLTVVIGKLVNW